MANNLLNITAYALLVKRPSSTIRLMCREGRLGAVKYGNEWLVDLSSSKTKNAKFLVRGRPQIDAPKRKRRTKTV